MAAGFRSAPAILTAAKQAHISAGYIWSQALDLSAREGLRAAARGLGPPKHAAAFPLEKAALLPSGDEPWVPDGPLGPRRAL
eukprot:11163637-Lingulodinium_polyedra.AAC.1